MKPASIAIPRKNRSQTKSAISSAHGLVVSVSVHELRDLVARQLSNFLMFDKKKEMKTLATGVERALRRAEYCYSFSNNKYFSKDGSVFFSPFHADQYAVFLYYLGHALWAESHAVDLADRVYYLNKILNGVELYYEVRLPDIFGLEHPMGTILGRAKYSNYFFAYQNCQVGGSSRVYPVIEQNVTMFSGSKIVGRCHIGKNSIVSANTYIKDQDVPDNSLVFGVSPHLVIKPRESARNLQNVDGKWKNLSIESAKPVLTDEPRVLPQTLSGKFVVLEPFRVKDITDEYIQWLNDPDVNRFMQVRFAKQSREMAIEYVSSYYGRDLKFIWAIQLQSNQKMVGTIALPRIDWFNKTAGIGIMVGDKRVWGTPASGCAIELVLEFAFVKLKLNRVFSQNVAMNVASNFMLRRAGFQCEGKSRQAYLMDGNFADGFDFGVLASDWRQQRSSRARK